MNAKEIISKSGINKLGISDNDKTLDGSRTFSDAKKAIEKAITIINEAPPKMKAAGVDMKKASFDAKFIFNNIIRKEWGSNEIDFYVCLRGDKAITGINIRNLEDITDQISEYILNF